MLICLRLALKLSLSFVLTGLRRALRTKVVNLFLFGVNLRFEFSVISLGNLTMNMNLK